MKIKKFLALLLAGIMAISCFVISVAADETTAAAEENTAAGETTAASNEGAEFDPSSDEYVAQMYIQVDGSWVFRNAWSEGNYGTITGFEYADRLANVEGDVATANDGTFTDVVLKGNGTYTVTLENPNFTKADGTAATKFNLIGVSTNIPASAEETLKITDMTIQVNDSAMLKYTYPEASFDPDGIKKEGYINVLGVNTWNSEVCTDANAIFCDTSNWPGEVSKVTVTFTVAGFDHDAPAAGDDETTAAAGENGTKADGATKADNNSGDKKDDSKGGLPTGAIIGIVAGAVLIVIIIIVVATSKKKKSN